MRNTIRIDFLDNGRSDVADLVGIDQFGFDRQDLFMLGRVECDRHLQVVERIRALAINCEPGDLVVADGFDHVDNGVALIDPGKERVGIGGLAGFTISTWSAMTFCGALSASQP